MYKKLSLFYFTGTGNSYRVAGWMAEEAFKHNLPCDVIPIDDAHPGEEIQGEDCLVGLVGPTHGFTAPWWMIRFALRLPVGKGAGAFTLLNRAGMKFGKLFIPGLEGSAAYLLAFLLWIKGYHVRGVTGMDMPSNWTVLHPSLPKENIHAIIDRAKINSVEYIQSILDGKVVLRGILPLILGILLVPISFLYLVMGRFFLSKLFYATVKCNGCGACARSCPVNAIRMKKLMGKTEVRPYWTFVCESCGRCFNFCPSGAVEASYPLGALFVYLANIPLAAWALDGLARWVTGVAGLKGTFVEWIIAYPWKLFAIFAAYALFSLILKIPIFNRWITVLTPTHYYPRYHEPGTRLSDLKR